MAFYEVAGAGDDAFSCRACLEINPENLFCLSQVYDAEITIRELFSLVTGIKDEEELIDLYPKFVCGNCLDRLEVSYAIKQKCIESDKKIRQRNAQLLKTKKLEMISRKLQSTDTVYLTNEVKLTKIKKPKTVQEEPKDKPHFPLPVILKVEQEENAVNERMRIEAPPTIETEEEPESIAPEESPEKIEVEGKRKFDEDSDNDSVGSSLTAIGLKRKRRSKLYMIDPDYRPIGANYVKKGRGGCRRRSRKPINLSEKTDIPEKSSIKTENSNHKSIKLEKVKVPVNPQSQTDQKNLKAEKSPVPVNPGKKQPQQSLQMFYCPLCKKPFFSESRMLNHKRLSHDAERNFPCTLCKKSFITPYVLQQHIETKHSENRPFTCTKTNCNKTFKTESCLKSHSLVHTRAKRFFCKECNAEFLSAQGLILHSQKVHQNDLYFKDVMKNNVIKQRKPKRDTI